MNYESVAIEVGCRFYRCPGTINCCNFCGFVWISEHFIRCPNCDGADYKHVPVDGLRSINRINAVFNKVI